MQVELEADNIKYRLTFTASQLYQLRKLLDSVERHGINTDLAYGIDVRRAATEIIDRIGPTLAVMPLPVSVYDKEGGVVRQPFCAG